MEYEFRRETATGHLVAHFSMGQEVIGFWFVEELGESAEKYQQICDAIVQLQNNELKHWRLIGKALSIELTAEEVTVFANELESDEAYELEEAMSIYDAESEAFCGLEDFLGVLESWREFIDER